MIKSISFLSLFMSFVGLLAQPTKVTINPQQSFQTIDAFSASDCWTGNYVGANWDEDKKEMIAKYLFSQKFKSDGSPEGIGLSMWRVNLGAGTAEQGDASDIGDISRRAECFLDENGQYDWTKQSGQQYFMRKAKEYGCDNFVAFSNSPLVIYTRNGKGYSNGDGNANLMSDKYDAYAEYLATVAEHFAKEGMPFSLISPVNEPQYDWKGPNPGQEGSPWQNSEIKKLVEELDKSIQQRELDTKILISEAGSWEYLLKNNGRASNQIYDFFDRRSANYIGNVESLAPIIGGHSYWTHGDNTVLKELRYAVAAAARNKNVKAYQTEWSLLSEASSSVGFVDDMDKASYMDIALFMAKIIHCDLSYAEVSSWSYWTAIDVERWSHKNRFLLLALEPGGNAYNPITMTGNVYDRSTLWALGNYSFFIRPGYKRVLLNGANEINGLLGSAYMSPDSSQIVSVFVNMGYDEREITTEFINTSETVLTNKRYITSSSYNLRKYGSASSDVYDPEKALKIPARSVMTVVYEFGKSSGIENNQDLDSNSFDIQPNSLNAGGEASIYYPNNEQNLINVQIVDIKGRVVSQQSVDVAMDSSATFNLPMNISSGVYIIVVQSGKNIFRKKVIVH